MVSEWKKREMIRKRHDNDSEKYMEDRCLVGCSHLKHCDSFMEPVKTYFNCDDIKEDMREKRRIDERNRRREETDPYYAEMRATDRGELRKKKTTKSKTKRKIKGGKK